MTRKSTDIDELQEYLLGGCREGYYIVALILIFGETLDGIQGHLGKNHIAV